MLYTKILNIIFPKFCISCSKINFHLCDECEQKIEINKDNLPDWIFAKYEYKNPTIKKLLFKLKYYHVKEIGLELGKYSKGFLESKINKDTEHILVPIPITNKRRNDRGYNQSMIIATGIEDERIRITDLLNRVKETKKLNKIEQREERQNELEGAFEINEELARGFAARKLSIRIILIDDITTTGASMYSARKTLTDYGFKKENILGFAIAH